MASDYLSDVEEKEIDDAIVKAIETDSETITLPAIYVVRLRAQQMMYKRVKDELRNRI